MDLDRVNEAVASVKLPEWVKGWRVSEDLDSDNEPILRVWFQVERDLDVAATHQETQQAQDEIRRALRNAGIDEWLIVVLEEAVRG